MTNQLLRCNPFRELDALTRRVLGGRGFELPGHPAVNVSATEEEATLTAEIPGLDPAAIDVTIVRDTVTLRGERGEENLTEGEAWIRRERTLGGFERTVTLPFEVDASTAEATYEDGVLSITVRRPAEHQPHRVSIRTS